MINFKNKVTAIMQTNEKGNEEEMTYADLALIVLNSPVGKEGWSPTEMSEVLKAMSKFEKVKQNATIKLEDAEFKTLRDRYDIKWRMIHKDIVAFSDYIEGLDK